MRGLLHILEQGDWGGSRTPSFPLTYTVLWTKIKGGCGNAVRERTAAQRGTARTAGPSGKLPGTDSRCSPWRGLQYKALDLQKCLLLESARDAQTVDTASCPDPKAIQIAASLIVLYALFGFQKQAEGIACQTAQAGGCTDWTEPKLNATVILVALIRLCRLAASGNTAASEDTAAGQRIATLEAEETSAEPVV